MDDDGEMMAGMPEIFKTSEAGVLLLQDTPKGKKMFGGSSKKRKSTKNKSKRQRKSKTNRKKKRKNKRKTKRRSRK